VFVCIDNHCYVITASHVVEGLWRKLEEQGPAHFQINQLIINPADRTIYSQAEHDLIVLAIDSSEITQIGRPPYRPVGNWPPPLADT
jgi:predicted amidohydrolase